MKLHEKKINDIFKEQIEQMEIAREEMTTTMGSLNMTTSIGCMCFAKSLMRAWAVAVVKEIDKKEEHPAVHGLLNKMENPEEGGEFPHPNNVKDAIRLAKKLSVRKFLIDRFELKESDLK